MRTEAGLAINAVSGLGTAAQGAADQFYALTMNIYDTVDAYLALLRVQRGGGKGGGKGSNTVGLRASGGPVARGNAYIVGEEGPELFTPDRSGYIVPNEDLDPGGSRPQVVINTGDVYGESYLKDYVLGLVSRTVRRELRLAA